MVTMASIDEKDMFGEGTQEEEEVFDAEGEEEMGSLEDSSPASGEQELNCNHCSEKMCDPRVLSCLHVFCFKCMETVASANEASGAVECPKCQQVTAVPPKQLPRDHVLTNMLDMSAIASQAVLCTSCKAQEKAVARCSDCANFLCPNCNTAHQFMRCFEDHHVVAFEDLKNSDKVVPIHKPIFCTTHPSENLKFFCYTCQTPICNECMVVLHSVPEHHFERLADAEGVQREELTALVGKSKERMTKCEETSTSLGNTLSDLEMQHDNARALIEETFQSYKALLEKCRDGALEDLNKLHSEQELKIMETMHSMEETMDRLEESSQFAGRLLEHGNAAEVLSLRKVVGARLTALVASTPSNDLTVNLEFHTDFNKFETALKATFGGFRPMEPTPVPEESATVTAAPPTIPPVAPPMPPERIDLSSSNPTSASPPSLPMSMQSSFESEAAFGLPPSSVVSPTSVTGPLSPVVPPGPLQLTSIQEYNLQQLASLAEKAEREQAVVAAMTHSPPLPPQAAAAAAATTPSSNPSPTPSFSLADLFSGDHAINNLQALAKLGSVSLNSPDLNNGPMNGGHGHGGHMNGGFGRPQAPSPNLENTLLSNAVSALNGGSYQNLSTSTSPMPDEMMGGDSMLNGGGNMNMSGNSSGPPSTNGLSTFSQQVRSGANANKVTAMQIRCKFGQLGPSKGQFNSPHGFCLGNDEDIVVADTNNHRIQVFEKTGTFKFQFGIPGKEEGQLWYPRKVAVMRSSGKFVVCDRGNERSRMQIFTKNGHFIKKIAIRYIDIVAGLAVNGLGQIVAVDSVSPTVFVIAESGDLLRWFDCSDYMREPSDIAISGKEFFVCDFKGHCVVVFNEDGQFIRRIGCENITNFPNGIDISDAGDVLVGDSHGNRFHVAVFTRDGLLLSEFECPYVKVSRCCGLKITSEGYVVTLAKNNHHVLVLNTLYIV